MIAIMGKTLIIVESPAKSKTIQKFLGDQYEILASYGHVRDLPARSLGVNIDKNFEPKYQALKDKATVLKKLKSESKKSDLVLIATDPDREGEAIAWHIAHAITMKGTQIKRIVFNEITESAIKDAIDHSREIDMKLVNAQQARRVLDRLIGYKLSPILSKKIRKGLSAGRVQSVAAKLICDREKLILAFIPEEYWEIKADVAHEKDLFSAQVVAHGDPKSKLSIPNESVATDVSSAIESGTLGINSIKVSPLKRQAPPPYITSTLQQDAARKLNWTTKKVMMIAQQLYEGVEINGEPTGLITYMRTDSTRISNEALDQLRSHIQSSYGDTYLPKKPNFFKSKSGAQDAHEAIRPTSVTQTPAKLTPILSGDHLKLYQLIWNRFVASQMTPCQLQRTTILFHSTPGDYYLRTSGQVVLFDGFTTLYTSPDDEESKVKGQLPPLKESDTVTLKQVHSEQKFTQPPARYTEASLVKEMEEKGIGRPSTYSPTLSTILDRGYVEKNNKSLCPTELGMVVNEQLDQFFNEVIDIQFTATMETHLDEITEGKYEWQSIVDEFYTPFSSLLDKANEDMEDIKFGERHLGQDPATQENVYVKIGRFGPMIQLGDPDPEDKTKKPKFSSFLPHQDPETVTLEEALELLSLPKEIGLHDGEPITAAIGKYGPYLRYKDAFYSLTDRDPTQVQLDEAVDLIKVQQEQKAKKVIQLFDDHDPVVQVLNGRYGPYINSDKKNYRIPKSQDPEALTLDDCLALIESQKKNKGKGRKKKGASK